MGAEDMLGEALSRDIQPWPDPRETSTANYERVLGSAILRGEIDATEALQALQRYVEWHDEGEPKLGDEYGTPA